MQLLYLAQSKFACRRLRSLIFAMRKQEYAEELRFMRSFVTASRFRQFCTRCETSAA